MKGLIVLVILIAVLVGLLLSGIADTSASIADTRIPDNEASSSLSEGNNSTATATTTITMYTLPDG